MIGGKLTLYIMMAIIAVITIKAAIALTVTVETQMSHADGTPRWGTNYSANFSMKNSTDVIFSNMSLVTTDRNGRFNMKYNIPYNASNATLQARWVINKSSWSEDTGWQDVGYVLYAVNAIYLQGEGIEYFATADQINSMENLSMTNVNDSLGNWSQDEQYYMNRSELEEEYINRSELEGAYMNRTELTETYNQNNSDVIYTNLNVTTTTNLSSADITNNLTVDDTAILNRIGSWVNKVTEAMFSLLHVDDLNATTINVTSIYMGGSNISDIYMDIDQDDWVNESGDDMTGNLGMGSNNITGTGYIQNVSMWNITTSGNDVIWEIKI